MLLGSQKRFLCNYRIPAQLRVKVLQSVVLTSGLYGAEVWGGNKDEARSVQKVLNRGLNYILQATGKFSTCIPSLDLELDMPPVYPILVSKRLRCMWKGRWLSRTLGDLIDSRLEWWSTKNTYLKTTERIAQEVLQTVGRGIIDDHLACGKEVPARWLDERRKCHVQMAFEMWGGEPRNGSPFPARDLVRRMIPRLWIRQLQESDAQFLSTYLTRGRASDRR